MIAIALLFLLHRLKRLLRYGADVRITPDHLMVKKHWSSGEELLKLQLDQVRLVEGRGEILVAGGRRKTRIGSGLNPEARHSIVEFLTGVIAGTTLDSDAAGAGVDVDGARRILPQLRSCPCPRARSMSR